MKKIILVIGLALFTSTAFASFNLTASCPIDGETAYFTAAKQTPEGTTVCKYEHVHAIGNSSRTATHSFWIHCQN
jgi:hypothetical protein